MYACKMCNPMNVSLFFKSFSTNGQKTILFKDQRLEFLADSADGLEFYDIQDVTDAYHCAGNIIVIFTSWFVCFMVFNATFNNI